MDFNSYYTTDISKQERKRSQQYCGKGTGAVAQTLHNCSPLKILRYRELHFT